MNTNEFQSSYSAGGGWEGGYDDVKVHVQSVQALAGGFADIEVYEVFGPGLARRPPVTG